MSSGRSGAIVPAGWGAYNALWVALLAGFGASALPLWLYGGAVALTEAAAAGVVLASWRVQARKGTYVHFARADAAVVAAIGVALLLLGPTLGAWFYPPGAVTFLWGVALTLRDTRRRARAFELPR